MHHRHRLFSAAGCLALAGGLHSFAQMEIESPGALPDAASLIGAALDKVGSADDREAVKSLSVKGTLDMGDMEAGGGPEVESFLAKLFLPGMYHLTASFSGGETAIAAHNGEVGWQSEPGDPSFDLMDQSEAAMFTLIVPHGVLLTLNEQYPDQETKEVIEIEGDQHYRITVRSVAGDTELQVFINASTGEFSAIESSDPEGIPARLTITGWERAANLNLPNAAVLALGMGEMGQKMTLGYSEVNTNTVDESAFEVPEEVKRQIEEDDDGGEPASDGGAAAGTTGSGST